MSPDCNNWPIALRNCTVWFCLLVAFVLIQFSCKKKESADKEGYSETFNMLVANSAVSKYNNPKNAGRFIQLFDSSYRQISNPTINDRFRYYADNFMYHRKTTRNAKMELLYADSMLMMAQKTTDDKQYVSNYAEANFAKGDALFDAKQFNDAYRCFYEGYFLGKNHLDNSVLAEYTYRMGMIMFRQSHFRMAANYFKESYRQSLSYRNDFRAFYQRQEVLNDIGESYDSYGNIDSAVKYYNKALNYINSNNDRFKKIAGMLDIARAVVYGDLGKIYFDRGDFNTAKDLLKKSIAINLKKYNDNYNAELVEINLAQLYLDTHDNPSFLTLMGDMHGQLAVVKNEGAETDWNRLMSSYYVKNGDYAKAIIFYKNYSSLKDSLYKLSSSLKETDVTQQLANYDKQFQIENLKVDNKLQLIYLYLSVICVSLAVIIIFLVYRNWGRLKRDVLAISSLNEQVSLQKKGLEDTLNELKLSSQEKDRILRTVVHDLRNPIGGIVSLTNLMLEDDYTQEQKQLISLVNGTLFNSLELINEILEATNDSVGKLNTELVEINSLVNNSVEILNFKAAEKHQKIIVEPLARPKTLYISRERIWRVISNLISNAIKFSPEGATILIRVTSDDYAINIAVADNGIGIPDEIKDHVFNIFTNAKRAGTAGEKSFGLGLSICQQIIENHKGKIWFESNVNNGTTFHISLPAA